MTPRQWTRNVVGGSMAECRGNGTTALPSSQLHASLTAICYDNKHEGRYDNKHKQAGSKRARTCAGFPAARGAAQARWP